MLQTIRNRQPEIQLFSYPTSPYAQKVGCYLKYKQLEFELVGVNPMSNAEIAFTNQQQVPVLKIGTEWRKRSSELGFWLDELFPTRPILPNDDQSRETIVGIDNWISSAIIPSAFRYAVEWQNAWHSITNGWRLARAVNSETPLPLYAKLIWPFAVKRAPFIQHIIAQLDLSEPMSVMNSRLQKEFISHLGVGPFLGEQSHPTLADLSAFPAVASGRLMGMRRKQSLIDEPAILNWAKRVQCYLPSNPLLVADRLLTTKTLD